MDINRCIYKYLLAKNILSLKFIINNSNIVNCDKHKMAISFLTPPLLTKINSYSISVFHTKFIFI